jgi:hypothetical protein
VRAERMIIKPASKTTMPTSLVQDVAGKGIGPTV